MRLSNRIVLASLNRHKLEEFQALLRNHPEVELVPVSGLIRNPEGLSQVEKHATYLENAAAKARLVNQGCHYPALADDSGLEVFALDGKPGVRSHRFAIPRKGESQDDANNSLLLKELSGKSSRDARFVCVVGLVIEGVMIHAEGTLEGTLLESPRGDHGFGYDPLFVPKGFNKSLAEMEAAEKNQISHRAKALQLLMTKIKDHGITFAKP